MFSSLRSWPCAGIILSAVVTVSGCGRQAPPPTSGTPAGPTPASTAHNKAEPPESPFDLSLTSEEYIRLGVPAHDRPWSADDMARAAKILTSLAQQDPHHLPRYNSDRSGGLFARIVSPQNLEFFENRSLPLQARLLQSLTFMESYNQINKIYLASFMNRATADSEAVELLGGLFRGTAAQWALMEEFIPTLKKDDPRYQVRMGGIKGTREAGASIIAGGLQTLTERKSYRATELARLVGYMEESFPALVPHLPPGSRDETVLRLEGFDKDPAMKDLQPGLRRLYTKVRDSVEKKNGH